MRVESLDRCPTRGKNAGELGEPEACTRKTDELVVMAQWNEGVCRVPVLAARRFGLTIVPRVPRFFAGPTLGALRRVLSGAIGRTVCAHSVAALGSGESWPSSAAVSALLAETEQR